MKLTDTKTNRYPHTKCGDKQCCPRDFRNHCPPTINEDADLIIVGEAPGADEVELGEGFVGDSGELLRDVLFEHDITEFSLDNIVRCRPPDNRTPYAKYIKACMNRTAEDIQGHSFVLLLGSTAMKAFFPDEKPKKLRGHAAHHPDFPEHRFFCAYHPAWALRNGHKGEDIFGRQIGRLKRVMTREEPWEEIVYPHHEDYFKRLEQALSGPRISFDIETTGLKSWTVEGRIKSWALTPDGETVFVCGEDDPQWTGANKRVGDFLEDPNKQIICMNGGFDLTWCEAKWGIDVLAEKIIDVQVAWHYLKGWKMPSLKQMTDDVLDGYRHLVPSPHKDYWDENLLHKYAAEDVIYTWDLYKKGLPQLTRKQLDLFVQVGGPSSLFLRRLTHNGLWFRFDHCAELEEELVEEREKVVQEWKEEDPDAHLIIKSSDDPEYEKTVLRGDQDKRHYLFDVKGLPVVNRTEKEDEPKTDKGTIKTLINEEGADQLEYYLKIKDIEKTLSTYVRGHRKRVEPDGRVHSDFTNTLTTSNRTSSRQPNVQNIERDPRVRDLYGAPVGRVFFSADYSQLEARIGISLCKDWDAIKAYHEGLDIHTRTAALIRDKDPQDVTKQERTEAKTAVFSQIYGGTTQTLLDQAADYGLEDWNEEHAEDIRQKFFKAYPKIQPWQGEIKRRFAQKPRGVVTVPTGYEIDLRGWDLDNEYVYQRAERTAINSQGQTGGAHITLRTGIEAQRLIRKAGLSSTIKSVCHVHDSLEYELPENKVQDLVEILEEANRRTAKWVSDWMYTPITLDYEVGESWGQLSEMEYSSTAYEGDLEFSD